MKNYDVIVIGSGCGTIIADEAVIPGDANGDGNVNAMDITKIGRIIAGLD